MSKELTTNLSSSKANTSIARWYAVQVASSCEKKVKATLEQRSFWGGWLRSSGSLRIATSSSRRASRLPPSASAPCSITLLSIRRCNRSVWWAIPFSVNLAKWFHWMLIAQISLHSELSIVSEMLRRSLAGRGGDWRSGESRDRRKTGLPGGTYISRTFFR